MKNKDRKREKNLTLTPSAVAVSSFISMWFDLWLLLPLLLLLVMRTHCLPPFSFFPLASTESESDFQQNMKNMKQNEMET